MAMLVYRRVTGVNFAPNVEFFHPVFLEPTNLRSVTNRDLLMTNWFVLEVIIRMRVAGVWEFFTNDQWMWNLGVCESIFVGSSWELTWTIWGLKMNEDDFVV